MALKGLLYFHSFAGYVAVCVQLCCRCFTVLQLVSLFTLHVSAYMAIFRCVGYSYFRILEGICFAGFTCTWLHFARFHLCFPVLFSSLILLFLACLSACLASKTREADSFRNTKIKHAHIIRKNVLLFHT
jgi:hypothetical protein